MVWLLRHLPVSWLSPLARGAASVLNLARPFVRLVEANIHAAMPELPRSEVVRIRRESFYHMIRNLLEFVWLNGDPERIRRCYYLPPHILERAKPHIEAGTRFIFVNPHLGSWEASGVTVPFYGGIDMAAIAKPVHTPTSTNS